MIGERIRGENSVGGEQEQKMKGRSKEINLMPTPAELLEQITPITLESSLCLCEDELVFVNVWLIFMPVCVG